MGVSLDARALSDDQWTAIKAQQPPLWLPSVISESDFGARQRMAAVCLYAHPEGFTAADVAAVTDASNGKPDPVALASLAKRLSALLPPA